MNPKHLDPLRSPKLLPRDRRFLERARREAKRSSFLRKQIGAVLVRGRKILTEAHNHLSHPRHLNFPGIDKLKYWSLHAEVAALSEVDARKATVYLFGFKNGRVGNSQPCALCEKYLRLHKVRRVLHTTPFGGIGEMIL